MATARKTRTPGADPAPEVVANMPADDVGSELPNAIDVDARAITGPVLTRQGYVCPDEQWQKDNPQEFAALRAARG